ncbi:hypothetical protein [Pyrococcus sp. ST04]|uniref:hypothetical protein n=1 Tax=Pyrococcus sp. ST04 TaxID=1183377 RepID=UPI0002605B18|nr:hypothetical protein [Pyrococcus sp. ST04]AFK22821.1 hypothetical protein Py04_1247 [Pyrococcus sp. ST04]
MRSQLSIDFLFAIALISVLSVGIISIGLQENEMANTFSMATKIKVLSITVRDSVTKAYSMGPGYSIRLNLPFSVSPSDSIKVTINGTSDLVQIYSTIGGAMYYTQQKLPVNVISTSSVILTNESPEFWIIVFYNASEGGLDVKVSKSPNFS